MAENGDNNENGNENGGNKGKESALDLTGLNENLAKLPLQIQEAVNTGVMSALGTVRDESTQARRVAAEKTREIDPADLETMSNHELSEHILGQVTKGVEAALRPINKKIGGVEATTEEDRIRAEAIAIAQEDPMFMEMRDEMADVAKRHPDLSVRDIYNLAKINNPEKVEKLQEANKGEEDKKKDEEGESPAQFGGLLPNSGVRSSDKGAGTMNPKDAANKAFDDVMKDVPTHILSGETG